MSHPRAISRTRTEVWRAWGVAAMLMGAVVLLGGCGVSDAPEERTEAEEEAREFERFDLATDTSKRIVELDEFISGGPPKDGIPALTDPLFDALDESTIPDDVFGVLVEIDDDVRFYPYNVLVWHEIVNEVVGGRAIAVTF